MGEKHKLGQWMFIQSETMPDLMEHIDMDNQNPFALVGQLFTHVRDEITRLSELHPERGVAQEEIPLNPAEACRLLMDLVQYHNQQQPATLRICVKRPGHEGEL